MSPKARARTQKEKVKTKVREWTKKKKSTQHLLGQHLRTQAGATKSPLGRRLQQTPVGSLGKRVGGRQHLRLLQLGGVHSHEYLWSISRVRIYHHHHPHLSSGPFS